MFSVAITPSFPIADPHRDFGRRIVEIVPALRGFARSLARDRTNADDLVQETVAKALAARLQFAGGTHLKAWLFTILRNHFHSEHRHRAAGPIFVDPEAADRTSVPGAQEATVALADLRRALAWLPAEQTEALLLVGAAGFGYGEAAEICGCAIGTIKSRVSRARGELRRMLDGDDDGGGAPPGCSIQ